MKDMGHMAILWKSLEVFRSLGSWGIWKLPVHSYHLELICSRGSIQSIWKSRNLEAWEESDHLEDWECGKSVKIQWCGKEIWKLGNGRYQYYDRTVDLRLEMTTNDQLYGIFLCKNRLNIRFLTKK